MQLHQIKSFSGNRNKKRVGRGGKHGTYSGRGIKGQKARAGRKLRPEWRDVLKRIPKRRGYKFKAQSKPEVLNLGQISAVFKENEIISTESLLKRGLISKMKGKIPQIKILGGKEITKKLNFKGLKISESARKKIKKIGGTII